MKKRLVRLLAWAVTAGILVLLFRRIPFNEVVAAARGAAGWTVPAAVFFGFVIYFADSFAIWKTFGWFLAPLSYGQVLVVRGATYLLAAINYNVGQGAIVYFVHRATRGARHARRRDGAAHHGHQRAGAAVLWRPSAWPSRPTCRTRSSVIVAVAYAGLAVYVVAVIAKPRWLASRPLFDVLLGAGLGGHLRALLVRLPHIAMLFTFQIFMLRGFGVAVPVVQAIAALPVVFFIAVLPISVQGLGTTQAAMVFFFARYAPGRQPRAAGGGAGGQPGRAGLHARLSGRAGPRLPEEPRRPRPDGGVRGSASRPRP